MNFYSLEIRKERDILTEEYTPESPFDLNDVVMQRR